MADEIILKIIKGNLAGEEYSFEEYGLYLVGRSVRCSLRIPEGKDPNISRRHFLLMLEPQHVMIRDLGSRNGTFVNGEQLAPGEIFAPQEEMAAVDRTLKNGDTISVGETVFSLSVIPKRAAMTLRLTKPGQQPKPAAAPPVAAPVPSAIPMAAAKAVPPSVTSPPTVSMRAVTAAPAPSAEQPPPSPAQQHAAKIIHKMELSDLETIALEQEDLADIDFSKLVQQYKPGKRTAKFTVKAPE